MTEIINNYLSPTNFTISVERLPNVEFFTQKASVPSINTSPVLMNSPLGELFRPGQTLSYGDLVLGFIVDENMNNYREVLQWLEGISGPESSNQTKSLMEGDGFTSDIILTITNSHKNPHVRFIFQDCFPTSLGEISLDVNVTDISYATCNVTFRYDIFKMEQL